MMVSSPTLPPEMMLPVCRVPRLHKIVVVVGSDGLTHWLSLHSKPEMQSLLLLQDCLQALAEQTSDLSQVVAAGFLHVPALHVPAGWSLLLLPPVTHEALPHSLPL